MEITKMIIKPVLYYVTLVSVGIFLSGGIMLIVFGATALDKPEAIIDLLNLVNGIDYIVNIFDVMPLFEQLSIFMICLGCYLSVVGVLHRVLLFASQSRRTLNAIVENECFHLVWITVLDVIAVIAAIVLMIVADLYPDMVGDWVDIQMNNSLNKFYSVTINNEGVIGYSNPGSVAFGWQNLQLLGHCCGVKNRSDFEHYTQWNRNYTIEDKQYQITYPPSCCFYHFSDSPSNIRQLPNYKACFNGTASYISIMGCHGAAVSIVTEFGWIAIGICSWLLLAETVGAASIYYYVMTLNEDSVTGASSNQSGNTDQCDDDNDDGDDGGVGDDNDDGSGDDDDGDDGGVGDDNDGEDGSGGGSDDDDQEA